MESTTRKQTPEEVLEMARRTSQMLQETLKSCQSTIKKSEEAQNTCKQTLQNFEDFKQEFQNAMNKLVTNIARGMGGSAIKNVQEYGKAKVVDIKDITQKLKEQKHFVFLTGAGISVASGIKTYRGKGACQGFDKDGVHYTNEEIATRDFMLNKSEVFWERYHQFYEIAENSKPNVSHMKIAQLQKKIMENLQKDKKNKYQFTLVTQNIDDLHVQAFQELNKEQNQLEKDLKMNPNDSIYQIHGNVNYGRCLQNCTKQDKLFKIDKEEIKNNKFQGIQCQFCQDKGRPNVLYFDENYNEENYFVKSLYKRVELLEESEEQFKNSNNNICLIVIGSTLETNMANLIVSKFIQAGKMVIEINRDQQVVEAGQNTYCIKGEAEKIVPGLCQEIQNMIK